MRVWDCHVHIQPHWMLKPGVLDILKLGTGQAEMLDTYIRNPGKFVEYLDHVGVERAGLVNYVAPRVMGFGPKVNDFLHDYCKDYPDRVYGYAGILPKQKEEARREMNRILRLGLRALKLHPPHQLLYPNEYLHGRPGLREVYRIAEREGVPVMIHTGTSVFPGARSRYGDPLTVDDVAVDFPDLRIIMAHGGRPFWTEEAFYLLRRHPHVYMDISSIPPQNLLRYFPRLGEVAHKAMFGSDWPGPGVPDIRANLDKFLKVDLPEETKERILWGTAVEVFKE